MTRIKAACVPAPDEPPPQDHESIYDAAWAKHPLRDHPRFSLARPDERAADSTLWYSSAVRAGFPSRSARRGCSHGQWPRVVAIAPVLALTTVSRDGRSSSSAAARLVRGARTRT
jgi:hypothetical protein